MKIQSSAIEIRPITQLHPDDLHRLMRGYTANAQYHVSKTEHEKHFVPSGEIALFMEKRLT
jgi:hypothetical protein